MNFSVFLALTVAVIGITCNIVDGALYRWKITDKKCGIYTGYTAGGKKPNIKAIASPVATFNTKVVAAAASSSKYSKGSGTSEILLGAADVASELLPDADQIKVKKITGKMTKFFKKASPFLGPAFGIIAGFMSFIPGMGAPSPDDILNEVNKGFSQLTEDINKGLENMKDYVDQSFIETEQYSMKNRFKKHSIYWTNCPKEVDRKTIAWCLRNAASRIRSEQGAFEQFEIEFKSGTQITSPKDVKRLEVGLPVFIQYVTLRLLCLQSLMNTYGAKKSKLLKAKTKFSEFHKEYREVAVHSSDYVSWAVNQIKRERNCLGSSPRWNKKVLSSIGKIKKHWQYGGSGIRGPRIESKYEAVQSLQCDPVNVNSKCSAKGWAYESCYIKCNSLASHRFKNGIGAKAASRFLATRYVEKHCLHYLSQSCKDISVYWSTEALSASEIWRKIVIPVGDDSFCTQLHPCGLGEGDCDKDSDCKEGLTCGHKNCAGKHYDSHDDCCQVCKVTKMGHQFRGPISTTTSGKTCQAWASQKPHTHVVLPSKYPNSGLDSNYCRNPASNEAPDGPWCYTMNKSKRWEYCTVPLCPGASQGVSWPQGGFLVGFKPKTSVAKPKTAVAKPHSWDSWGTLSVK